MKNVKISAIVVLALGFAFCFAQVSEAVPMGTAFTYQGRLIDANSAADGLYDLEFSLYDANVAGTQKGPTNTIEEVDIIDGYLTVLLDFGSVFDGQSRWLEIGVRPGEQEDPNDYTLMEPRQEVTPTPYSLYSALAGDSDLLDGLDSSQFASGAHTHSTSDITSGTLSTSRYSAYSDLGAEGYLGNASGDIAQNNNILQVNLNADRLDGLSANAFAGSSHNHDATNITSGNLSTSRYSALSDLGSEGYLGNAAGDLAQNNGILQVTLNADLLDGLNSTAFAGSSHDHSAVNITSGTLSTSRYSAASDLVGEGYLGNAAGDLAQNNGVLQVTLNADMLDGQHGSYYQNATNLNAGTIAEARLPQNAIDGSEIQDNSITTADIATDGVGADEIATGAVGTSEIANGSVTSSDLLDGTALSEILDDDGPGSGLNADYLDGSHSSAFSSSSHSHYSLNALDGSPTNALYVDGDGEVGIGTTDPTADLHIHGSTGYIKITNPGTGIGYNGFQIGYVGGSSLHASLWNREIGSFRFATSNLERMRITEAGRVGIGTDIPNAMLEVATDIINFKAVRGTASGNNSTGVYGSASGSDGIGLYGYASGYDGIGVFGQVGAGGGTTYAGYFDGNLHVAGDITYTGSCTDVSDIRLKENITPLKNGIEKISRLKAVYFNNKGESSDNREVGVIAQDVEKVLPELVLTNKEGFKSVDYTKLSPVLIEAVKELKAENDILQEQNKQLESRLSELENAFKNSSSINKEFKK